jgi:hypothetical protein
VPSQIDLTVNSLADSGSGTLRAAIQTADAGSHSDQFTIGFAVTGTIDLQSPLPDLNNNISIQGPGAASLTIWRDYAFSFTSAIVTVDAGQTASLSGLTVANGYNLSGNGGGIANFGVLTVSGCTLSGNSAADGGGIFNNGTLTVSGCAIHDNGATDGGGIFNALNASATVTGGYLSNNSAVRGGGIYNDGELTVSGGNLQNNPAEAGGGIFNDQKGHLTIQSKSIIENNYSYDIEYLGQPPKISAGSVVGSVTR